MDWRACEYLHVCFWPAEGGVCAIGSRTQVLIWDNDHTYAALFPPTLPGVGCQVGRRFDWGRRRYER